MAALDHTTLSENGALGIAAEEFAARRALVFDAISPRALAVLQGAPAPRGFPRFRQSNEFYYLSGIEVPHAYMLLHGPTRATTLYLPHRDARHADADGETMSAENEDPARRISGVERVSGTEQLAADLTHYLYHQPPPALFTPAQPAEGAAGTRDTLLEADALGASDPWDTAATREGRFIGTLRERFPQFEIRDLSPVLDRLRLVKSPAEIALLRKAARLCGLGVMEAMRSTAPGVVEYQLGGLAKFIFLNGGAQGEGYRAIIAGGANIWHMHYSANNQVLIDGDLVLMDYAPDYRYYTSDIGRMWPVGGAYAPWQRELYGFMVKYHLEVLKRIRPAVKAATILEEAAAVMREVVARTAFSKPAYEQAARRTLDFNGHLSHPVGMAVHDVGDYWPDALAPGLVITVDPQMWIPEEHLYVRVEDTIVVTADGCENLTAFVPRDPDEIEAFMRQPGLLQHIGSEPAR
jgi:Xaa-Pro aminopeptidase